MIIGKQYFHRRSFHAYGIILSCGLLTVLPVMSMARPGEVDLSPKIEVKLGDQEIYKEDISISSDESDGALDDDSDNKSRNNNAPVPVSKIHIDGSRIGRDGIVLEIPLEIDGINNTGVKAAPIAKAAPKAPVAKVAPVAKSYSSHSVVKPHPSARGLNELKESIAPEPATGFYAKSQVTAKRYMVVAGHDKATKAGLSVLKDGGSAVDAVIAAQMVLNVVEPQSSGIGGGGFLLHYDARTKGVTSYDGRETAPKSMPINAFLDSQDNPLPFLEALKGGRSVGTPGLLRMLELSHKKYGKLPWKRLFRDAIILADNGFSFSPRLRKMMEEVPHYQQISETAPLYQDSAGKLLPAGTIIRNPQLAEILSQIASYGSDVFYRGKIAQDIVDAVQNNEVSSGTLSLGDMAEYKVIERDPVCIDYRIYKICSMGPPSSGGVTILQSLKMLESFDLHKLSPFSVQAIHRIASASRLAYADRNRYLADSDFVPVPLNVLLDDKYLSRRGEMLKSSEAMPEVEPGEIIAQKDVATVWEETERPSTTHISVVDGDGNAVAMTSSIEYAFGSGVSVHGFLLNNQLTDFSFLAEHEGAPVVNRIEGGKRPRSSMSPTIVLDDQGKLRLVVGSPGGARIIGYVLHTVIAVLDWKKSVQEAINLPRFVAMRKEARLELEDGHKQEYIAEALKLKGYEVTIRDLTSGLHAIEVRADGLLVGGADPRREGEAAGK